MHDEPRFIESETGGPKTKRKNTPDPHAIDFVTGYSVDECVERLERGPARTLDHRLNVRVEGSRFVVEAERINQGRVTITADVRGTIQAVNSGTLVRARFENKNPIPAQAPYWLLASLFGPIVFVLLLVLFAGEDIQLTKDLFYSFAVGVGLAAVMFFIMETSSAAYDKHVPDLKGWLHDYLYTPPHETDS